MAEGRTDTPPSPPSQICHNVNFCLVFFGILGEESYYTYFRLTPSGYATDTVFAHMGVCMCVLHRVKKRIHGLGTDCETY